MKRFAFIIVFLLYVTGIFSQNVKFSASTEKVVALGERFRLTYEVNTKGDNLQIPQSLGQHFHFSGPSTSQSSSIQIINGKKTRSDRYSYTFFLQAKNTGKFTIGPAKITVDGKNYTSNSVTIEVVKGNQAAKPGKKDREDANQVNVSGEDLFVRTIVNKRSAYVGEQIFATIKIYTRLSLAGFEDSKFPSFRGFWTQEIETPNQISLDRENINGTIYNVGVLQKQILFPQRSGEIQIDPVELTCVIRKRVRPRSFFDNGFRDVRVNIKSRPVTIDVKPLPANKPVDFSGAVGAFNMTADIDKTSVKTNDAINLTIKVSGNGNIKLVEPLNIKFPPDFDTYKPEIKVNTRNTERGAVGTKTFSYLMIPRHAGEFTIPPVNFTYFDTQTNSYKSVQSDVFNISVEKGEESSTTAQYFGPNKTDVKTLDKDIRFIKTNEINLRPIGVFFTGSPEFYLIYAGALVIFLIIFLIRRKQARKASNVLLIKNRRANKISRKRLKKAAGYMKHKDKEHFYDEILRAMWGYLSDKLAIPVSSLTRETVVETLKKENIDEEISSDLTDLLDTCEFAKYAPAQESGQMEKIYERASKLIGKLSQKLK
jgi:hypothetical protein